MPLQWCNQIWQSLEEGAGKRCSECDLNPGPSWQGPDCRNGYVTFCGETEERRRRKRKKEKKRKNQALCVMMRDYKVLPQTRNVRGALAEMVTIRSVIKLKKNDKKRKKRRRRRRKKHLALW